MLPKGFQNPFQVRERLKQLQEKAYTINDFIGKTGVEATFDPELRGYAGKKTYEIDIKGNPVRELPGFRRAVTGQRLLLSISSELQEYAEQLLAQHEKLREVQGQQRRTFFERASWIKGGAIVAMDPKRDRRSVLALASYPRIDLNDFIPSKMHHEQEKKKANPGRKVARFCVYHISVRRSGMRKSACWSYERSEYWQLFDFTKKQYL